MLPQAGQIAPAGLKGAILTTQYLLIDFENVQPASLELLHGRDFQVFVVVGASQAKIPLELAASLQELGRDARYVRITGSGRNALDFHIAYLLGELAAADPGGQYHVISRDTGFDPLIAWMNGRGIQAHRCKDLAELPLLRIAREKGAPEKLDHIVANLASRGASRPRKVKTLKSTINALYQKGLPEAELDGLVEALVSRGQVSLNGDSVTYRL